MSSEKFNSVWDAIEDTSEASANMKVRAELMLALQDRVVRQSGTQAQKADKLGITQPRLNDLMRGRINKFSLDALVNLASRARLHVDVRIHRACVGVAGQTLALMTSWGAGTVPFRTIAEMERARGAREPLSGRAG